MDLLFGSWHKSADFAPAVGIRLSLCIDDPISYIIVGGDPTNKVSVNSTDEAAHGCAPSTTQGAWRLATIRFDSGGSYAFSSLVKTAISGPYGPRY